MSSLRSAEPGDSSGVVSRAGGAHVARAWRNLRACLVSEPVVATRRLIGPGCVLVFLGLLSATSASPHTPARSTPRAFTDDYRISDYLSAAAQIQAKAPDERIEVLRILAHHPRRSPEIIPLCRMPFEAKEGEPFRRPALGGPWLIAHGSTPNWPLEPIAIFKGVPILVARGYTLLGHPESPLDYLEYCLKACKWREDIVGAAPDMCARYSWSPRLLPTRRA